MTALHDTVDAYLTRLEHELRGVDPERRAGILDDVRAHLAEAAEQGRELEGTVRELGAPADVARDVLEQTGIVPVEASALGDRAARWLHSASVVVAVVTSAWVALSPAELLGTQPLLDAFGLGPALLTLVPAAFAALPLLVGERLRRPVALANALL